MAESEAVNTPASWSKDQVTAWLASLGYEELIRSFKEHNIAGKVLLIADHEMLKELGVRSVGRRLSVLKAVQNLKVQHGLVDKLQFISNVDAKYESILREEINQQRHVDQRVSTAEYLELETAIEQRDSMIKELGSQMKILRQELIEMRNELNLPEKKIPSTSMSNLSASNSAKKKIIPKKLGVAALITSPENSKSHAEEPSSAIGPSSARSKSQTSLGPGSRAESAVALSPGDTGEIGAIRVHADKLLNRENEPYKTLRVSVNDACSHILTLALKKYKIPDTWQKYALFISHGGSERCLSFDEKPLALQRQIKAQTGEVPIFSLKHIRLEFLNDQGQGVTQTREPNGPRKSDPRSPRLSTATLPTSITSSNSNSRSVPNGSGAICVGVYEYRAEREDELNIAIGDKFQIVQQDAGWFIVQNIQTGAQGWVPASCLSDEKARNDGVDGDPDSQDPLWEGMAVCDFKADGANELSMTANDHVKVYQRANHWLFVELHGERGWVPQAYVKGDPLVNAAGSSSNLVRSPEINFDNLSRNNEAGTNDSRNGSRVTLNDRVSSSDLLHKLDAIIADRVSAIPTNAPPLELPLQPMNQDDAVNSASTRVVFKNTYVALGDAVTALMDESMEDEVLAPLNENERNRLLEMSPLEREGFASKLMQKYNDPSLISKAPVASGSSRPINYAEDAPTIRIGPSASQMQQLKAINFSNDDTATVALSGSGTDDQMDVADAPTSRRAASSSKGRSNRLTMSDFKSLVMESSDADEDASSLQDIWRATGASAQNAIDEDAPTIRLPPGAFKKAIANFEDEERKKSPAYDDDVIAVKASSSSRKPFDEGRNSNRDDLDNPSRDDHRSRTDEIRRGSKAPRPSSPLRRGSEQRERSESIRSERDIRSDRDRERDNRDGRDSRDNISPRERENSSSRILSPRLDRSQAPRSPKKDQSPDTNAPGGRRLTSGSIRSQSNFAGSGDDLSNNEEADHRDYPEVPYEVLRKAKEDRDTTYDLDHLERYLSNADCVRILMCQKDEIPTLASWKLLQRKRRANL